MNNDKGEARRSRVAWMLGALLLFIAPRARAAELAAAWGATGDALASSYAWGLEFRERFVPLAGASFAYLNEGHVPGHHRDGLMLEGWGDIPMPPALDRIEITLGIGPYLYCDTQADDSVSGFRDYHSLGVAAMAALTWFWRPRWFARLSVNEVHTPGNVDSRTVLLGVGVRDESFESGAAGQGAGAPGQASNSFPPANEIGLFAGQTVMNDMHSARSTSFGVEYRRLMGEHVELSGAWIRETERADGRHAGVEGEAWLVQRFFSERLSVGFGAGPFLSLEPYRTGDGRSGNRIEGVASSTIGWRITRHLLARLEWHRGFTHDDQDCDIVTAGASWSWGR